MKRVVIIGADFAPSSYPPALRVRFFAQHLPELGWEPIVVTIDPKYYEWAVDPENEKLLPSSLHVIRTRALAAGLTRRVGVGDIGLRSMYYQWQVLSNLCKSGRVDLVFIPVPPYMSMLLGRLAYARFRIPYVIDYIDPWVTEYYRKRRRAQRPRKWPLSYAVSRILEPIALKHVGHIVSVSTGTTESIIARYQWLTEADSTDVPYGGETGDFDFLRAHPRQHEIFRPSDGLLHISYVGACIPAMHATVRALFEGIRSGLTRSPQVFSRLRMHFVGTTYAPNADRLYQVIPLAREIGLEHYVDEHPARVPYLDALQLLLDSHALLVLGSDARHYTASKIFPYILARRPLLAVFHEASSVVTILRETQAGHVVTFSSQRPPGKKAEEISRRLEEMLLLPCDYQPPTRWEAFEPYTTRATTARLVRAFEKAVNKQRRKQGVTA